MNRTANAAAGAVWCAIAFLGIVGCGSGGDGTEGEVGTYSGDFWDLPRGRENEPTGTTTYGLDTITLGTGDFAIAAVVRTCPASGCSDESLGAPSTHCHAHFQVHAGEQTTLAVVVRGLGRRCGFAVG